MQVFESVPQRFARPRSSFSTAPLVVASELSALLERLGIEAAICDADGVPLASTPGGSVLLGSTDMLGRRVVEVEMFGERLCVSVPTEPASGVLLDLTPRQRSVVELIARGLRNREIAEEMGISLHTVRRHVEGLLRRLNVPTRAAAAVLLRQTKAAEASRERGPRRVA